ncbi:hypothetical protein WA158_000580 [Blastocystis sp. Blastoise]
MDHLMNKKAAIVELRRRASYKNQVGGHNRMIYLLDGRIAKPYSYSERKNYETVISKEKPLVDFLATYFGTFSFCEVNKGADLQTINSESEIQIVKDEKAELLEGMYPIAVDNNRFLVLSDLAAKYNKPCILDIKMGTRTYWDGAPEFKVQRHIEKALKSTTSKLGLRLCGMKLYIKEKKWGKTLNVQDILMSLSAFFFDGKQLRKDIIKKILHRLLLLRSAIEKCPWRFWSSSLLFVYEGEDWTMEDIKERSERNSSIDINIDSYIDYDIDLCPEEQELINIQTKEREKNSISRGDDGVDRIFKAEHDEWDHIPADVNIIDLANCNFDTNFDTPDEGYLFGLNNLIAYMRIMDKLEITPDLLEKMRI